MIDLTKEICPARLLANILRLRRMGLSSHFKLWTLSTDLHISSSVHHSQQTTTLLLTHVGHLSASKTGFRSGTCNTVNQTLVLNHTLTPSFNPLHCIQGYVHEGLLSAAEYVIKNTKGALAAAAVQFPGWPLLVTGGSRHSSKCC